VPDRLGEARRQSFQPAVVVCDHAGCGRARRRQNVRDAGRERALEKSAAEAGIGGEQRARLQLWLTSRVL
jgi:hypothetical protein